MTVRNHVLPFFTRRDAEGREQAVCGAFVTAAELAPTETAPSCWGCALWLDNLDVIEPELGRVIATITPSAPWGERRLV